MINTHRRVKEYTLVPIQFNDQYPKLKKFHRKNLNYRSKGEGKFFIDADKANRECYATTILAAQ